jgi:hypothetical protein
VPAYPSFCLVPNNDGVNNGTYYYSTSPSQLSPPGKTTGGAYSQVSPSLVAAPIYSSDRGWPYAWYITQSGQVNVGFTLNQFGGQRGVWFYYGARKTNTVNYSSSAFVGAGNGSIFWTNGNQPLSSSWFDGGLTGDTWRASWNYAGGWNMLSLSPTGAGVGFPVDPIDVDYVAIEVRP